MLVKNSFFLVCFCKNKKTPYLHEFVVGGDLLG